MKVGAGITLLLFAAQSAWPAMVVTRESRFTGKIESQNDTAVVFRGDDGKTILIPRENILQVFDDKGELIWQGELPPEEKHAESVPGGKSIPPFARRAVIVDFSLGGVGGGVYAHEHRYVDDLRIYSQYSDGAVQFAESSTLGLGFGVSYQGFTSDRWSTLISYMYRTTTQSVTIGDGLKYEKNLLANEILTRRHALFYGKELHFFPANDPSTLDLIAQLGYEIGSYMPLVTYREYRTLLNPTPEPYTGSSVITIHGPSARLGGGITFRGTFWQFRLLAFYQAAVLFLSEKTPITGTNAVLVRDFYGGASFGYGW